MIFEKHFLDKDIEEAKKIFKQIKNRIHYLDASLKDGEFKVSEQILYEILERIRSLGELNVENQYTIQLLKTMEQMKSRGLKPMEVIRRYETKQN